MMNSSPLSISSRSKKCKKVDVRPLESSAPSQVLTSRSDTDKTPWPANSKLIKTNSNILKTKAKTSKTFYLKALHKAPDAPLEESNSMRHSNGHFPRLFGFASDDGKVIDAELHKKFKAETLVNAKQKLQSRISKFFENPAKPNKDWAPDQLTTGQNMDCTNLIGPNIKTRIEDLLIIPIELNFKSPTKCFGDEYPKLKNQQKIELIRKKSKAQKRDEIYKKNNTLTWKIFLPDLSKKKRFNLFTISRVNSPIENAALKKEKDKAIGKNTFDFKWRPSTSILHELHSQKKLLQKMFPNVRRQLYLAPNDEVRLMDYTFPFNSAFQQTNQEKNDFYFHPYASILDYKEIMNVKYEEEYDYWTLDIVEKMPYDVLCIHSINNGRYFIEWLNSLGDDLAHRMAEGIADYVERIFTPDIRQTALLTERKTYHKMLSAETLEFIRTSPYLVRVHKLDFERGRDELVQYIVSRKLVEMWTLGEYSQDELLKYTHKQWRDFFNYGMKNWITIPFCQGGDKFTPPEGSNIEHSKGRCQGTKFHEAEKIDHAVANWEENFTENYNRYSYRYHVAMKN
jgi:hypothetical protein